MINEAKFPQPWIDEYEATFIESPCITQRIEDFPQAEQDRINALRGSRNRIYRKFKLGTKVMK